MDTVQKLCRSVADAGGRALIAGGWVRDHLLGRDATDDIDFEVYGLGAERMLEIAKQFGHVDTVGASFTVIKLFPRRGSSAPRVEYDIALPRRESKTGRGHRGFSVEGDPSMSYEEAARRRDFTINAMMFDPLTEELIDLFGGRKDLDDRILRMVDPETFVDDSLRVLRGAQFVARLGLAIDPGTEALCRSIPLDDLPSERIWGEFDKLLHAAEPSRGLEALRRFDVLKKLFPELDALIGCRQDPAYHPEGDVWTHTLMVADEARALADESSRAKFLTLMLAAVCHDLGKPPTTHVVDGRVRALAHDHAGLAPAAVLLDRLAVHTLDGYDARRQVLALVAQHLVPLQFYHDRDRVSDGAFRRLARRVDCSLLSKLARADALGRTGAARDATAVDWFESRISELGLENGPPDPLLMGRHVLDLGLRPGPLVGEVTKSVYELQLDGSVTSLEEAIQAARRVIAGM